MAACSIVAVRKVCQRTSISVPISFEKAMVNDNGEGQTVSNSSVDEMFNDLDLDDQLQMAHELRASAEADLKHSYSRYRTAPNKRDARELPGDFKDLIRHEVERAVAVEGERVLGGLRQQVGEEIATASREQSAHFLATVLGEDYANILQDTPSRGVSEDLLNDLALSITDDLRDEAEKARQELDSNIVTQLADVMQRCSQLSEIRGDVDCGWREDCNDRKGAANRSVAAADGGHSLALECDDVLDRQLEGLVCRIAATVELEHKARQESELWLRGRITDLRNEIQSTLAKVLALVDMQNWPINDFTPASAAVGSTIPLPRSAWGGAITPGEPNTVTQKIQGPQGSSCMPARMGLRAC